MNLDQYHTLTNQHCSDLLDQLPSEIRNNLKYIDMGKGVRIKMTYEVSHLLGIPAKDTLFIATTIETIHFISIILDDFIDSEVQRRQQQTLNSMFSSQTITHTSNFLLSKLYETLTQNTNNPEVITFISQKIKELCLGEIQQDFAQDSSEKTRLLDILQKKTGSLFAMSFAIPSIMTNQNEKQPMLEKLGYLYGILFQSNDDIKDIVADSQHLFKDDNINQTTLPLALWRENHPSSFNLFLETQNMDVLIEDISVIKEDLKQFLKPIINKIKSEIDSDLSPILNIVSRDYPQYF